MSYPFSLYIPFGNFDVVGIILILKIFLVFLTKFLTLTAIPSLKYLDTDKVKNYYLSKLFEGYLQLQLYQGLFTPCFASNRLGFLT